MKGERSKMAYLLSEKEDATLPLATLWAEIAQAHAFTAMTEPEALATLERQRVLTKRILSQCQKELSCLQSPNMAAFMMMDHSCELLEAGLGWLDRTIARLQAHTHAMS
jgi:hypothetical protein